MKSGGITSSFLISFAGTSSVIHMHTLLYLIEITNDALAVLLISKHSWKESVRWGVVADDTPYPLHWSQKVMLCYTQGGEKDWFLNVHLYFYLK